MSGCVDLYEAYGRFTDPVLAAVRAETFGRDIGQNSWLTADELDRFIGWLELRRVLRAGARALFSDPVVVTGAVTTTS